MQTRVIANRWRRRSASGMSDFTPVVLPGQISGTDRGSFAIDDHGDHNLPQVRATILRMSILAEGRSPVAFEVDGGGV